MAGHAGFRARFDHKFTLSNLSAYLDGALTAGEKARLERHLLGCSTCQRDLASMQAMVGLLRHMRRRPVPRSFALPLSVRSEQLRCRRWNQTYSFLRMSAVAVSFVLVVLLCGDALFGSGFIAIPDLAAARSMRTSERAPEKRAVEALKAEREVAEAPATVSSAGEQRSVVVAPAEAAVAEAVTIPAETSSAPESSLQPTGAAALKAAPEALAPAGVGGTQGQGVAPEAAPTEPQRELGGSSEATPASRAPATAKSLGIKGTTTATAVPTRVALPETASPTAEPLADTTTMENAAPTPEVKPLAESAPSPTMGRVAAKGLQQSPSVSTAEAAEVQQEGGVIPGEANAPEMLSGLWALWRVVRLLSGVLVGLLLVLLAGLLWAGQRRRT